MGRIEGNANEESFFSDCYFAPNDGCCCGSVVIHGDCMRVDLCDVALTIMSIFCVVMCIGMISGLYKIDYKVLVYGIPISETTHKVICSIGALGFLGFSLGRMLSPGFRRETNSVDNYR